MWRTKQRLIIFDRAHGQSGTASKGNGIITRNVDARLFTAQAYARYNFNPHWAAGIKTTYNYGHNETDGRPLYQIRPFEAAVQADYKNYFAHGSYNIGAATRFVAKQTRGDFDIASGLGIDKREAAKGFTVADVYAGMNIKDKYGLRLGVNNMFNKKIRRIHQRRPRPRPVAQRRVCTGQDILVEFACGILKSGRLKECLHWLIKN